MGAIIAQSIAIIPIPFILLANDPEAFQVFMDNASGPQSIDAQKSLGLQTLIFTASTLIALISWIVHRLSANATRRFFGRISAIAMATSLVYLGLLISATSGGDTSAFTSILGEYPLAYACLLLGFPLSLAGLFLVQKFLHKRTLLSLHTAANRFDWARALFAIVLVWVIYGLFTLAGHLTGLSSVKMIFNPQRFFIFALISLMLIPLQSATEEILFRGYFNQALGHYIRSPWIVFAITSVLFAALHLANPEAQSGADQGGFMHLLVMSNYFLFGFLLSVIVYFEGGLEAAIGVHAGNNLFAALFVNYEGSVLPTPSIFLGTSNPQWDLPLSILILSLVTLILFKTRKKIQTFGVPSSIAPMQHTF
jgi:membrane protease YdiL (CAAX protease family)